LTAALRPNVADALFACCSMVAKRTSESLESLESLRPIEPEAPTSANFFAVSATMSPLQFLRTATRGSLRACAIWLARTGEHMTVRRKTVDADGSVGQAVTVRRKLRSVPVGASSDCALC